MKTYAEHVRDILLECDLDSVSFGDLNTLSMAYERRFPNGGKHTHPLDRNQAVLNALEKSPLFTKAHMDACDSRGHSRVVRVFTLKEKQRS